MLSNSGDSVKKGTPEWLWNVLVGVACIAALSLLPIPFTKQKRDRLNIEATVAMMKTIQLAAEEYGVKHDGYYADCVSAGSENEGLVSALEGQRLAVNAFTEMLTEPRLGPVPDAPPPGSIWYTPELDTIGRAVRYTIVGAGPNGVLDLVLSSGQ